MRIDSLSVTENRLRYILIQSSLSANAGVQWKSKVSLSKVDFKIPVVMLCPPAMIEKIHNVVKACILEKQNLSGIVHMDHIRSLIFESGNHDQITVKELMRPPAAIIERTENSHSVLQKFEETKTIEPAGNRDGQ
jgi:predicted transcriptional regulator